MIDEKTRNGPCKQDADTVAAYRRQLPALAEKIIENCDDQACFTHINDCLLYTSDAADDN